MKKLLSIVLSITILLSITAGVGIAAEASGVGKVSNLTVSSTAAKSVSLKWKTVQKATGYQVYYSTSKNKDFKKAKTIKKGSVVTAKVAKLKSNKTYYFKVRAVKGKATGKFSNVISAKTKKSTEQIVKGKLVNGYLYFPWLQDIGLYEYKFNSDGTYVEYDYVPAYKNGKATKSWGKYYYSEAGKYSMQKGTYKIKGNKITLSYVNDYNNETLTDVIFYDTNRKIFRTEIWGPDPELGEDYSSYGKYTYRKTKMKTSEMDEYWNNHTGVDNIVKV
ncbi:MAG: fibronectin type III domain-containing protein [Eubacterium sp.]|nr:fibronectin type III domain-containing protein [Eubacterium sp.]